jgi:hypothetical protein
MMTVNSNNQALMSDWRALGAIISACFSKVAMALIFICSLAAPSLATPDDPLFFQPGLRNSDGSRKLNNRQLQMVIESLRHKTGFLEMRFDENGFLTLGDRTRVAGGSAVARELLIAAVDGGRILELENHTNSLSVSFAQIRVGDDRVDLSREPRIEAGREHVHFKPKARTTALRILIDFADFSQLCGEREVLAAFDLGFAVLHELGHGALQLRDSTDLTRLGECEEYINRIRRDLGLPERLRYFTQDQRAVRPLAQTFLQAEQVFVRAVEKQGRIKTEWFYLRWDIEKVGQGAVALRPGASRADQSSIIAKR